MQLHELKPACNASKAAKRKGRGHASGNGKTAGYGHKGQKARSGSKKAGFEGGQLPLQRRLPKIGFNNIFRKEYNIVNLDQLNRLEEGTVVDRDVLVNANLIKNNRTAVKVLGNGTLTKKLTVKLDAYTATAKEGIEKAGGKVEVV